MPEVHGKGLGDANIRDNYITEIETAKQQADLATKAAQKMVAEKIQRESTAKKEVYGQVLGNMYDGDRAAIQKFRDHIKAEFQAGVYSKDPSLYQTRVANLNAMIDNAENFYNTTYGTDAADGKGNTYRDIQIRHQQGNSVEFWEEQGLELQGDEWMEAQERLQQLQEGMYRDLQFTPDGNVMARAVNPETGELGDLMGFENLPQREIGSQNFQPDVQVLSPATLMDLSAQAGVQTKLRQLYNGLLTEEGQVMYNGKMTSVKGMSALDKMNYMSDLYFQDMIGRVQADGTYKPAPNTAEARAFRRSIAKDLGLSGEELRSFVEGDINSLLESNTGTANLEEAKRHWREVTRQAFLKPTTTTTEGGGTKIEEPDFVRDRYQFNLNQISEEDRLLAGIMGPFEGEEISGDGLEEPIKINASRAFEEMGIPTEKANYEIYGAAFHSVPVQKLQNQTGVSDDQRTEKAIFIARVQLPELVSTYNEATGETESEVKYVTKDVIVSSDSVGWRKEIYNNLLNNSSDLAMAMASRKANWAARVAEREGVPTPNQ